MFGGVSGSRCHFQLVGVSRNTLEGSPIPRDDEGPGLADAERVDTHGAERHFDIIECDPLSPVVPAPRLGAAG